MQSHDRSARKTVLRNSTLRDAQNNPIDVVVSDLSITGFSMDAALDMEIGAIVRLGLGGAGTSVARIVRRTDSTYGCQFLEPLNRETVEAAFRYNEALTSIGGSTQIDQDADSGTVTNRWPLRIRGVIILVGAIAGWGALLTLWLMR